MRTRTASGVTSTSSSASIHSIAVSMVSIRGGGEHDVLVLAVVAHVGELLLLDDVHVGVVRAVVLADDHPLVDLGARARGRTARAAAGGAARTASRRPARSETMAPVLRASSSCRPTAPSRRTCVLRRPVPRVAVRNSPRKPMSPRLGTRNSRRARPKPGFDILTMRAAALAEALGHDADERVGHVDDDELHRLARARRRPPWSRPRGCRAASRSPRGASSRRGSRAGARRGRGRTNVSGRLGLLDADGEVLPRLALEALAEVAAGEELRRLALAGERRRVDADAHLDRRLLDEDARQRARLPAGVQVDDRVADVDVLDARRWRRSRPPALPASAMRFSPSKVESTLIGALHRRARP